MDNQNNSESKVSSYLIPISIVVAGVLVALAVWLQGSQTPPANNNSTKPVNVSLGDLPVLGEANAPVTFIEFGDYQCPFCEQQFKIIDPVVREQYVKSGQVKMVWRDFAFLDEFPGVPANQKESHWAAEAARCANDQGKFWQYHDYIFSHQAGENKGGFSKDNLKKFAGELGLDQQQFNSCLDSDKYMQAVKDDTEAGKAAGVNSTPFTFINGESIKGLKSLDIYKTTIEKYLTSK